MDWGECGGGAAGSAAAHPRPSVVRAQRLADPAAQQHQPVVGAGGSSGDADPRPPALVPWGVARLALFTSWAPLSPLSRAVHCNIGHPELWALLPVD
jgi:hypothetical protein